MTVDLSTAKAGQIAHFRCGGSAKVEMVGQPHPEGEYYLFWDRKGDQEDAREKDGRFCHSYAVHPFDIIRLENSPHPRDAGVTKDTGGSAFPHDFRQAVVHEDGKLKLFGCEGMSLRDWFAGMALQGMLAGKPAPYSVMLSEGNTLADATYEFADAMISARKS